jgi:hypothetical protein
MAQGRRSWVRGAVVLGVAGTMMAAALMSPALAVRLATTSYVKQKVNQAFNRTFGFFLQTPIAVFRSDPIPVAPNTALSAAIACPAGGVATGGGASGAGATDDWDLESSYPSNGATTGAGGTGWAVVMENATPSTTLSFRVYVVCGGGSSFTNFPAGSAPLRATEGEWSPGSATSEPTVVTKVLPR